MTKLQVTASALVVGGLAITAIVQYQGARTALSESETLRQQMALLAAENEALSNRLQTSATPPANEEQLRELIRLRGEVAALRQQTNAIARVQEENRRLQARAQAVETATQFEATEAQTVNAGKQIGLGMRMWANDNKDVFPTNFVCLTNELPNLAKQWLESFELVNVGVASEKYPTMLMARERLPRRNPEGTWSRVYVFCDGSVQRATTPDGNFEEWEKKHTLQLPPPGQ